MTVREPMNQNETLVCRGRSTLAARLIYVIAISLVWGLSAPPVGAANSCKDLIGGRAKPPVEAPALKVDPIFESAQSFDDLVKVPAELRERYLLRGLNDVPEFRAIRELAEKHEIQVFLFGGMAASYMDFQINRIAQAKGWVHLNPARMARGSFFDIYSITQDFDLVADGDQSKIMQFEADLNARFPYKRGKLSAWEVRLLKESKGGKVALLDSNEFLIAHNDSHSTYLIELSGKKTENKIHELHDFDATWKDGGPKWFDDFWRRRITYLHSPKHEESKRAIDGKNPPVFSVIRILNKAFRGGLKVNSRDQELIAQEIDDFDPVKDLASEYSLRWLSWAPKKLVQSPMNLEAAFNFLDKSGLRKKLLSLGDEDVKNRIISNLTSLAVREQWTLFKASKNPVDAFDAAAKSLEARKRAKKFISRITDLTNPDSMLSWLSRQPLRSKPIGEGSGRTAAELGIERVRRPIDISNYLDYELLQRASDGSANVFQDGGDGSGFKTEDTDAQFFRPSRDIIMDAQFNVAPEAREGSDFKVRGSNIVFFNKAALKVDESTLRWPVEPYFERLKPRKSGDPTLSTPTEDQGYLQAYRLSVKNELQNLSDDARMALLNKVIYFFGPDRSPPLEEFERIEYEKNLDSNAREVQLILGNSISPKVMKEILRQPSVPAPVIVAVVVTASEMMAHDASFAPTKETIGLVRQLFDRFERISEKNSELAAELYRILPKTALAREDWLQHPGVHELLNDFLKRGATPFNRSIQKHTILQPALPAPAVAKLAKKLAGMRDPLLLSRMLNDKNQRAFVLANPENLLETLREKQKSLSQESITNFTKFLTTLEPLLSEEADENTETRELTPAEYQLAIRMLMAITRSQGSLVRAKQFWKRSNLAPMYITTIMKDSRFEWLADSIFLEKVVSRGYLDHRIDPQITSVLNEKLKKMLKRHAEEKKKARDSEEKSKSEFEP